MKRNNSRYTGTQKFILFCFFAIVAVSVVTTGLLIKKSMDWINAGREPSAETETVGEEMNTLQNPSEETVPFETEAEVPSDIGDGTGESALPVPPADAETPEIVTPVPEVPAEEPEDDVERATNSRPEWNLILVNTWNPLPDDFDFTPNLFDLLNGHFVDERMYPDLQQMMDDARAEGLYPIICSSYRSYEKQQTLFDNQVQKYLNMGYTQAQAEDQAAQWVVLPGTSEHHTGLAVDIVALDYQLLDENQENTPEQKWLMENAHKYGFILRYPSDKSELTGVHYEPWHYRYVGRGISDDIYEQGICLEEYLLQLQ